MIKREKLMKNEIKMFQQQMFPFSLASKNSNDPQIANGPPDTSPPSTLPNTSHVMFNKGNNIHQSEVQIRQLAKQMNEQNIT